MKAPRVARLKPLLIGLAIVALVTLNAAVARGDEVIIAGSTTGAVTGVPSMSFSGNANFTGTTFLGVGALSGGNRLGTFSLSAAPGQAVAGLFTLNITFASPTGIAGGQAASYTATVQGNVSAIANNGGVRIDFDNSPVVFTFSNGNQTGSFSLAVADVFVQTGQTANLTASITGTASSPLRGLVGSISFGEAPALVDGGADASVRAALGSILLRADDFNQERIILDMRPRP